MSRVPFGTRLARHIAVGLLTFATLGFVLNPVLAETLSVVGQGVGNVVGPASSTDTGICIFNGTTGKIIKNSLATIDSGGGFALPANKFIYIGSQSGMGYNAADQFIVDPTGAYTFGSLGISTPDVFLTRRAAATLGLGAAAAASPVAYTIQGQPSRSGTDSNVGGANVTLQSGNGTGTGTLSTIILQSPVAAASGTGAQTQTTGLTIKAGAAVLTSYVVSALPAAATAGAGAVAFVTDAATTAILGLGTTVTGGGANKVVVYSDGTNWIYI